MHTPQQKLGLLQRSLYEEAYHQATQNLIGTSYALRDYYRRFERDLSDEFSSTSLEQILKDFQKSRLVLVGDFHTLKQTQKGFVRLLKAYINKYKTTKIVIALEAFRVQDQQHLNDYLAGKVDDEEFLRSTNYHRYWNFPWQNFKLIFDFARLFSLEVIGVNSTNAGKDPLNHRDRFAANVISETLKLRPGFKVFTLIGELHLSSKHLPAFLQRRCQEGVEYPLFTRVVFNVDKYYLSLNNFNSIKSTEYLSIGQNYYCVLNTPPWLKWQSYNLWEESHLEDLDNDDEVSLSELENMFESDLVHHEIKYDVESHFLNILKIISGFLGLTVDSSALFNFNIFTGPLYEIKEYILLFNQGTRERGKTLLREVEKKNGILLADTHNILLIKVSVNSLADMAGRFLMHQLAKKQMSSVTDLYHGFYYRVIEAAAGYYASKILNPKRRCMTLSDYKAIIKNQGKGNRNHRNDGAEIAKAIVCHHDWVTRKSEQKKANFARPISSVYRTDRLSDYQVSHFLGQAFGDRIYHHVMSHKSPRVDGSILFKFPLDSFQDLWINFAQIYSQVFLGKKT